MRMMNNDLINYPWVQNSQSFHRNFSEGESSTKGVSKGRTQG